MANPNLLDPVTKEAMDKGLSFPELMAVSTMEMAGWGGMSKITGTGFDVLPDGTIINEETKEPIPLPEAISNVIPLFRKQESA